MDHGSTGAPRVGGKSGLIADSLSMGGPIGVLVLMWEGTHMWREANGRTAKGGEGGRWLWVGIEAPLFGLQVYVSTMESRNHPITATQRRTHSSGERSCAPHTAAEPWKSHMQVGDSAFYNMTSPGGGMCGLQP
jgi:hypothetical protein